MAIAYSDIARILDRARTRQGAILFATAVCAGSSGALAATVLGAGLLGAGLVPSGSIRYAVLGLASICLITAAVWALVLFVRRALTPVSVARTLGGADAALKSDLVSSIELRDEYDELRLSGRYSVELVDEHIARTAAVARSLDLGRLFPWTPARRAAQILGGVVVASAVAFATAPDAFARGWKRLGGDEPQVSARRPDPITGDVELTYTYPAYMRREPKTIAGTGGEVNAPLGSEVRLSTSADREVLSAELAIEPTQEPPAAPLGSGPVVNAPPPPVPKIRQLEVKDGRKLEGRFLVEGPGQYRFRFTRRGKVVAEGPAIPIVVEPDAPPEVRITAPAQEIEVDAKARVRVEWMASDDVGLGDLTLVVKPPAGDERRVLLRAFGGSSRRETSIHDLDLIPYRLAEGEQIRYWLEVTDGDAVSGPKRSASATHTLKVFSLAEHHRVAIDRGQALWEELVRLLGDRLEFFNEKSGWTPSRIAGAQVMDRRARDLHDQLRVASQEMRRDAAAPKGFADALASVAAGLRGVEQHLTVLRGALVRATSAQSGAVIAQVADLDGQLDRELERDVLYLEQLLDRQRAEDLVRAAKDISARRRDLASLLEKYRKSPTEAGKKEMLSQVARMKAQLAEMMRRMSELAKGLNDEHMNQEALAEVMKSSDALGGLDQVEKQLARGDIDGAMKALDQMAGAMEQMLSSLERTAGIPGEKNAALMKEMVAFKGQLEELQGQQDRVARETEKVKEEYQRKLANRARELEPTSKSLQGLVAEAQTELKKAERGVTLRSEDDYAQSRDRLNDLERALAAKDLDAALESVRRTLPPMQRLALGLEDDAAAAERYRALRKKDPKEVRQAKQHAVAALQPTRKVKEILEQLFPDPRAVLAPPEQQRLGELAQQQAALEHKAGELRKKLSDLAQQVPVFPPQSQGLLGSAQGHMQRAHGELTQRNPQRGHGQQRQALEALARFKSGLDEMAKKAQRGSTGPSFPFPFGEDQGGREGEGLHPSAEKVEIPGAEAYRVPDEFRRDLLDAMKQGAPEPYSADLQRYYEELVK